MIKNGGRNMDAKIFAVSVFLTATNGYFGIILLAMAIVSLTRATKKKEVKEKNDIVRRTL